ncbi:MAG: diguanylate cyclase [Bacillota bacterium]
MAKIITILAVVPGAGATITATNIAAWLAALGAKTLLIDLSSRGVISTLFLDESSLAGVFPTTANWREFTAESLLRAWGGLAVLPGPAQGAGKSEGVSPVQPGEILEHFASFEAVVIDAGGEIHHPHVRPAVNMSDVALLVAEPTQRCVQAASSRGVDELMKSSNTLLVINRISRQSFYHPRDVARLTRSVGHLEIPEDPAGVNGAIRRRLPLVLYGRGKASASLRKIAGDLFDGKTPPAGKYDEAGSSEYGTGNSHIGPDKEPQRIMKKVRRNIGGVFHPGLKKKGAGAKLPVVALVSPWMSGIGTTLLAKMISEMFNASIVDADLKGRGLGVRLGMDPAHLWEYDWRSGGPPVKLDGGRSAWVLDPHVDDRDTELRDDLKEILRAAKAQGNVIIDAGSDPLAWYAREVIEAADAICIPVSADPLLVARSLPHWRQGLHMEKPAQIALLGEGDPGAIEDQFRLKCVQVCLKKGGGIGRLVSGMEEAGRPGTLKMCVYVAGLTNHPSVSGVDFKVFTSTFSLWRELENGERPDALVFAPSSGVEEFIKELRNSNYSLPLAIIGDTGDAYYKAGADACYDRLTVSNMQDLLSRKNHTRKLVERDELTGCYRRLALNSCLSAEVRRYNIGGEAFSVLMCDLDYFKGINDTHGHQAGDQVLEEFGSFLCSGVRRTDKVIRYGGEEFVLVFPRCRREEALAAADNLRREWEGREGRLPSGEIVRSTFSGGVAEFGRDGKDVSELLEAADRALYRAKEEGRNRILSAGVLKMSSLSTAANQDNM